jgi:hypothetical protein
VATKTNPCFTVYSDCEGVFAPRITRCVLPRLAAGSLVVAAARPLGVLTARSLDVVLARSERGHVPAEGA